MDTTEITYIIILGRTASVCDSPLIYLAPDEFLIRGESVEQGGVLQELRVATHTSLSLSECKGTHFLLNTQ